ncbi:acetyltransferase, ribosomal protein N-acetylase [Cylindrospermum stagnale PCC 7417]|uniref:Acetyltransferase, ribosomal protein N-acetylase n=1 Tax=Cylindrospermum stagnale PCC 7417 TaxID=56107 RepID=K9X059_9NOST|nr:GNAT family N-acetyltransferase [Cylindrospermum stagnale]AFZ25459.1 acetyltransferase, ribosomal protein N-acetylase [Cylindrospermum stagnale PCC 7417]
MNNSWQITTRRLELLPCSLEVAEGVARKNKSLVEELLGVKVPDDWYASEVLDFFPIYAQMLLNDPSHLGWGVWLMIHLEDSTLIGDLGFGGKPDEQGTVEMGYEVLPAYRHQGYAFEAVEALVNFAFTQPELQKIISYCPQDHPASIRILEKLGMKNLARFDSPDYPSAPILTWEMELESKSGSQSLTQNL